MARHVLAVDDEPLVLDLMVEILEGIGWVVETACSGAQALFVLERNSRIEVLISDINMPGMSGYELADRAKRIRPSLHVLLLSGRETNGHGFPLIHKPFFVSKRLGSLYRSGRTAHWVKVKNPKAPAVTRAAEEDWT